MEEQLSACHKPHGSSHDQDLAEIRRALQGIQFGSLHVVIQDGVVVQIDRTERRRPRRREKNQASLRPGH